MVEVLLFLYLGEWNMTHISTIIIYAFLVIITYRTLFYETSFFYMAIYSSNADISELNKDVELPE